MGEICVDGTTCQCPPKPPMREGTAWYHTDKRRRDKWETDHDGHVRATEGRIRGGLRGLSRGGGPLGARIEHTLFYGGS